MALGLVYGSSVNLCSRDGLQLVESYRFTAALKQAFIGLASFDNLLAIFSSR